jgi:RNA polymerase sigma-70 factor (ECF subfamily)
MSPPEDRFARHSIAWQPPVPGHPRRQPSVQFEARVGYGRRTRTPGPAVGPMETMASDAHQAVMEGLAGLLPRLWRYGLVLSGNRDTAEELVQATCVRALERSAQFSPGTRLDRWLIAILHSIWLNEIRSRKVRQGQGLVDADAVLVFDGIREIETNILAAQVLAEVQDLPEMQRETVYLVYVEGLSYREAADVLSVPIGTIMSRLAAARAKLARLAADADGRQ